MNRRALEKAILNAPKAIQKTKTDGFAPLPAIVCFNDLSDLINEGRLLIPPFQRQNVWNSKREAGLLNFMLSGIAPLAAIYTASPEKDDLINYSVFPNRTPLNMEQLPNGQLISLIDGLQRVSTFYKAITGELKDVYFDLINFCFVSYTGKQKSTHVGVDWFLNPDVFWHEHITRDLPANYSSDRQIRSALIRCRDKLFSYQFTNYYCDGLCLGRQQGLFVDLNQSPMVISQVIMNTSFISSQGFNWFTFTGNFQRTINKAFPHLVRSTTIDSFAAKSLTTPFQILQGALSDELIPPGDYSRKWSKERVEKAYGADGNSEELSEADREEIVFDTMLMCAASVASMAYILDWWPKALTDHFVLKSRGAKDKASILHSNHLLYAQSYLMWINREVIKTKKDNQLNTMLPEEFSMTKKQKDHLLKWAKSNSFESQSVGKKTAAFRSLLFKTK